MLRHVELLACLKILDPGRQKYFNQKVSPDIPGKLLVNVSEGPMHAEIGLNESEAAWKFWIWLGKINQPKNHAKSNFIKVKPNIIEY